mgnify:FL=1
MECNLLPYCCSINLLTGIHLWGTEEENLKSIKNAIIASVEQESLLLRIEIEGKKVSHVEFPYLILAVTGVTQLSTHPILEKIGFTILKKIVSRHVYKTKETREDVIIWQLDHWPDWLEEAIEARTMALKKQGYK